MEYNDDNRQELYKITKTICANSAPNTKLDEALNDIILKEEIEPSIPFDILLACAMRADPTARLEGTKLLVQRADEIENPNLKAMVEDHFHL